MFSTELPHIFFQIYLGGNNFPLLGTPQIFYYYYFFFLLSTATRRLFYFWEKEGKVVTIVSDAVPYTIYSELCYGEAKIKVKFVSATELFSCEYWSSFLLNYYFSVIFLQLLMNFPEFAAEHKLKKTSEILKYYFNYMKNNEN